MKVGTIVKLKKFCLGNAVNTRGVVFNEYATGSQVIFENGCLDGFSDMEEELFGDISEREFILEEVGFDPIVAEYEFKNDIKVTEDFRKGLFSHIF